MLYTDTEPVASTDLYATDGQAQEVADIEEITVDGPLSVCQRARDFCTARLLGKMETFESWPNQDNFPLDFLRAIYSNDPVGNEARPRISVSQMILVETAGEWSALKQWMVAEALKRLYEAAYGNTISDRYLAKLTLYEKMANKESWSTLQTLGVAIVGNPLSRPAALHELNTGTWGQSNVSAVAGTGPGGVFDVAITYVCSANYTNFMNTGNGESAPTDTLTISLNPGQIVSLNFTTLVPPTGNPPPQWVGVYKPLAATGINVYAAPTGQPLTLQNLTPLSLPISSFSFNPGPGYAPVTTGQYRTSYQSFSDMINRI